MRAAAGGQAVFGSSLAQRLPEWFARRAEPAARSFPQLTDRERDILDALAAGLTNVEIGQRLYLSPKTIANNVTTILTKLQVTHRAEAVILARDAGLGRNPS